MPLCVSVCLSLPLPPSILQALRFGCCGYKDRSDSQTEVSTGSASKAMFHQVQLQKSLDPMLATGSDTNKSCTCNANKGNQITNVAFFI